METKLSIEAGLIAYTRVCMVNVCEQDNQRSIKKNFTCFVRADSGFS